MKTFQNFIIFKVLKSMSKCKYPNIDIKMRHIPKFKSYDSLCPTINQNLGIQQNNRFKLGHICVQVDH